ncbi:uncharacterized protein UTRI_04079 [Ustilago trichophora]|uniref:CREG-like beta-barrel domain-containing protein n=1 Tax=Ustilago trichophora TaxID=86804 RepID=A0A5C3E8P2_9BASI|nr:uncharacterized protein UTRI_04079 [Ustilago trichophora]
MIPAARVSKLLRRCFYTTALMFVLCTTRSLAWETKAQALEQAVHLVHDPTVFGVSTLSTRYPSSHPIAELAGHVISGPEYFAPCEADTGTLLYLGLTVSQTWKNILNSDSKIATVSIASNTNPAIPDPRHSSGHDSKHWEEDRPSWRRGMPSKARITLFGHFSILNVTEQPEQAKKALHCYLDHHPDASHWAPDSDESPHIPFWATFTVDKVYWVGGFGDEHYIGWFSSYEWNTAWKQHRPTTRDWASNNTASSLPEDDARLLATQIPLSTPLDAEEEDQHEMLHPKLAFQ